jgi:hypothetical protein
MVRKGDSFTKTEARSADGRVTENALKQQPSEARLVRKGGLEPPRSCDRQPLKLKTSHDRSKPTPENRGRLSLVVLDRGVSRPVAAVWLANSCEEFGGTFADDVSLVSRFHVPALRMFAVRTSCLGAWRRGWIQSCEAFAALRPTARAQ